MKKNPSQKQDNIPGIYNYCDRWCERCEFTSRCANFEMQTNSSIEPEVRDMNNTAFWKSLSDLFNSLKIQLEEVAQHKDIDIFHGIGEDEISSKLNKRDAAKNHPCSIKARDYISLTNTWFEESNNIFIEKEDELKLKIELHIDEDNSLTESIHLKDRIEVIRWYQYQIYVKLSRALEGLFEDIINAEDEQPRDSDGSAKVALIGIDRSVEAWTTLHHLFPDREDDILDILLHLDRLEKSVENIFPNARSFVRPGFDSEF